MKPKSYEKNFVVRFNLTLPLYLQDIINVYRNIILRIFSFIIRFAINYLSKLINFLIKFNL